VLSRTRTAYPAAPVLLITDAPCIILLTFASALLLLASVIGLTGTLLNSRSLLAVYVMLLFPASAALVSVGYLAYHKTIYSLDGKLSQAWNNAYAPAQRLLLQSALSCCGWVDVLHAAAPSGTCYPRAALPGCRVPLGAYEREVLATLYCAVFALVPAQLFHIAVGLLCANHVTYRFGKGVTPRRYRLHVSDLVALSRVGSAASAVGGPGARRLGIERPDGARVAEAYAGFREDKALPGLPPGL
jgi:hypothetical protein